MFWDNAHQLADELRTTIEQEALSPVEPTSGVDLAPYLEYFHSIYGDKLEAIIFYGSCLSSTTKKADSTPDFFIIAKDGNIPAHPRAARLLHSILPPSSLSGEINIGEKQKIFKYIFLDLAQLQVLTSPAMKDLFVAGRLSKRVKLLYYKSVETKNAVTASLASAVASLVPPVFSLLPTQFDFNVYLYTSLSVSYFSEVRIESGGKVDSLLSASRDHYANIYNKVVTYCLANGYLEKEKAGTQLINKMPQCEIKRAKRLLRLSRWRGTLRWPKFALAVKHWAELQAAKIERAYPNMKLKPQHLKHPFIFGIPYLILLLSRGYLKVYAFEGKDIKSDFKEKSKNE